MSDSDSGTDGERAVARRRREQRAFKWEADAAAEVWNPRWRRQEAHLEEARCFRLWGAQWASRVRLALGRVVGRRSADLVAAYSHHAGTLNVRLGGIHGRLAAEARDVADLALEDLIE